MWMWWTISHTMGAVYQTELIIIICVYGLNHIQFNLNYLFRHSTSTTLLHISCSIYIVWVSLTVTIQKHRYDTSRYVCCGSVHHIRSINEYNYNNYLYTSIQNTQAHMHWNVYITIINCKCTSSSEIQINNYVSQSKWNLQKTCTRSFPPSTT